MQLVALADSPIRIPELNPAASNRRFPCRAPQLPHCILWRDPPSRFPRGRGLPLSGRRVTGLTGCISGIEGVENLPRIPRLTKLPFARRCLCVRINPEGEDSDAQS